MSCHAYHMLYPSEYVGKGSSPQLLSHAPECDKSNRKMVEQFKGGEGAVSIVRVKAL